MERQTIRIRRVGSVTFGIVLIAIGSIFLTSMFFRGLSFEIVFQFWPVILISLGIEVLAGSRQRSCQVINESGNVIEQNKIVYDVPAILLTMVLIGFSCCMALLNWIYLKEPMGIFF